MTLLRTYCNKFNGRDTFVTYVVLYSYCSFILAFSLQITRSKTASFKLIKKLRKSISSEKSMAFVILWL